MSAMAGAIGSEFGGRAPAWPGGGASAYLPSAAKRFETDDPDHAFVYLSDYTDSRTTFRVSSARGFERFSHFRANLGRTRFELFQMHGPSPQEVATRPFLDHEMFLYVPIRGALEVTQGKRRAVARPGDIAVVSPTDGNMTKRWTGPAELLCILVDRRHLLRLMCDEYGVMTDAFLTFSSQFVTRLETVPTLSRFLTTVCEDLNSPNPCFTDETLAQAAERTLLLLAIQSFPHDLSDRINRAGARSAPAYMRRAEEFIRENLGQPISVETLAAHAGTSVRSLYYGFNRAYGVTPMRFLRRVRLEAARTALRGRREEPTTVTEIAFACGYGSLSSFCRDYKSCFGEAPSQTARRC